MFWDMWFGACESNWIVFYREVIWMVYGKSKI